MKFCIAKLKKENNCEVYFLCLVNWKDFSLRHCKAVVNHFFIGSTQAWGASKWMTFGGNWIGEETI